jgi:hypothetical protein
MSAFLASAYPNSALSALTMMVIGFVVAGALALWLALVFLAGRKPIGQRERQSHGYIVTVASPGQSAHDGHGEAAGGQAATRREAAA